MPSARDRLEQALSRIADPQGEGARACLTVYAESARAAADAADARARADMALGPLDGAIVSIKDLFDVAGEVTRAGSRALAATAQPAAADAVAVRRLRAAGAVIVAKTNMTEFAFSGVGMNPHFGTPGNPADRARIPGGSSSGAAITAADGMCEIAIGTDTGGSMPHPGRALRHRRLQAKPIPGADHGGVSALVHARLDRAAGAHGCGLRQGRRGDGGRGFAPLDRRRSPGYGWVCSKGCPWQVSTRRSAHDLRTRSAGSGQPGCGLPTRPSRCSTTWRR